MTKLEAVNIVLRAGGGRGVGVLDTGGASTASDVERMLDEKEKQIQARGWHYNTRVDVELTPDGNGYIDKPATAFTADTYGQDAGRDVVWNGDRLYDRDENTQVFTGSLRFEIIDRWEFHCIPDPIARWIAHEVSVEFWRSRIAPSQLVFIERDRKDARVQAHQFESDHSDTNILDSDDARRTHGRSRAARFPR